MSYDRSYPEHERLYRLTFEEKHEGFYRHTARILHWEALNRIVFTDMLPGIEQIARLAPFRKAALIRGESSYNESYAYGCDPAFLDLFQPEVIRGQKDSLLYEPYTLILTQSTARKIFGEQDPVGQSIELIHQQGTERELYRVVAVIRDFPSSSHFRIAALTSFENPMEYQGTAWTYLRINPAKEPQILEHELEEFIHQHVDASYAAGLSPKLQKIADIHLHSHKAREIQSNLRWRTVWIIMLAGVLIFLLAWFNFTLLSFSQNQFQLRRLIIQWQMGAGKPVIFRLLLADNLIIGSLSLGIGLVLTLLLAPHFEQILGLDVFTEHGIRTGSVLFLLLLILFSSGIAAWYSTQRLYLLLQKRYLSPGLQARYGSKAGSWFIRAMIIVEFIITFILLANLFMIHRQTTYAMEKQLGASQEAILHLPDLHREVVDSYETFRDLLLQSPHIASVTASMEEPTGQTMDARTFRIDGVDEGEKQLFLFPVDQEFFRFYDLEILYGKDFPLLYDPHDSAEFFVLNETAAHMIGENPEELIGKELDLDFGYEGYIWPGPVTGIVEDFHFSGLDYSILPMVIFPKYTWLWCFSIKTGDHPEQALQDIQSAWESLFPDYPLEYHFGSELIEELYAAELTQSRLLLVFSGLSILIAGMGLFALSGLFMQKKMKAAALRKINGAKIRHLIIPELLSYLLISAFSAALATPPALFLMEKWLRNFQYRADMALWIFPLCMLILILFSWLAVLYHSLKLARIEAIKFLREA